MSASRTGAAPLAGVGLPLVTGFFFVFLLALLLGGGRQTGSWGEAFVQLASLPLLVAAILKIRQAPAARNWRLPLAISALAFLAVVLQMIPLPAGVWELVSGRAGVNAIYAAIDASPSFLPLTLDPGATLRSLFTLIPPLAIFLTAVLLPSVVRERAVLFLLAFAFVSVILGLAQIAQGTGGPLRIADAQESSQAVGFFANQNHFAALIYAALPLAAAWALWLARTRGLRHLGLLLLALVLVGALMIGVGAARSRAGVAMGLLALAGIVPLAYGLRQTTTNSRLLQGLFAAGLTAAVLVSLQFALVGVLARFEQTITDDLRFEMARTTMKAIGSYFPFGSGFGTFPEIYNAFERLSALRAEYVNHAHNDYLELVLEGGIVTLALLALFLMWFIRRSATIWFERGSAGSPSFSEIAPRAASISIVLLLLHSTVDYPLRMTALIVVFAFLCALMVPPPDRLRRPQHGLPNAQAFRGGAPV